MGRPGRAARAARGKAAWACALGLLALPVAASAKGDLCRTGRQQSPIDIVAAQPAALPPLAFDYRPAPLRAVNDGHTVRVRFADGSRMQIGGQPHTLQQFHFHLPGGDRIAGEEFAMAMHLLHKSPAGQLVPLVLLFRLGDEHPALAALLPQLPARGEAERTSREITVDAAAFLPAGKGYYSYTGSETAPPCTEGVHWLVLQHVQTISAAQRSALQRLFPANARPVQPLNGRVVQLSR